MSEQRRRVLVVDDEIDLLNLIATLLRRIQLEPVTADNAMRAAQLLRQPPLPELIVLDLMLPDVSGVEFLKQMRSKPVFDNIPVLVLSALVDPDVIREALEAGADRYLTKPYVANNLLTVVGEMLKTGRRK